MKKIQILIVFVLMSKPKVFNLKFSDAFNKSETVSVLASILTSYNLKVSS